MSNHAKIQEVLENDRTFQTLVANKDTEVESRSGRTSFSSLTVRTAEALASAGYKDKTVPRPIILAVASKLMNGQPLPVVSTKEPEAVAGARKRTAKPTTKAESEGKPVEVRVDRSTPEDVSQPKPPENQVATSNQLATFMDKGDILRFQSAVAIAQLLAAVFQLAEHDTWAGHEKRKEKINILLDDFEQVARNHVNLSVKQIVLRAQIKENLG
jgi:hypothetical protein